MLIPLACLVGFISAIVDKRIAEFQLKCDSLPFPTGFEQSSPPVCFVGTDTICNHFLFPYVLSADRSIVFRAEEWRRLYGLSKNVCPYILEVDCPPIGTTTTTRARPPTTTTTPKPTTTTTTPEPEIPEHRSMYSEMALSNIRYTGNTEFLIQPQWGVDIRGVNEATCVLHFNPRFDKGYVVTNFQNGGKWGSEVINRVFPFEQNKNFDVELAICPGNIQVHYNGQPYQTIPYRHTAITPGNPSHDSAYLLTGTYLLYTNITTTSILKPLPANSIYVYARQRIQFIGKIIGSWKISLLGLRRDILFQMVVDFEKQKIVCNSFKRGVWGIPESNGVFPFIAGETQYTVEINRQIRFIQVVVNGLQILTFNHRTPNPLADYRSMNLDGEFNVWELRVRED